MSDRDNNPDSLSVNPTDESFDDLLEHEYHDLLRRIAADGAAWRRALPTTDALARRTHSLGVPPLPGGAPVIRREDTRMEPTAEPRDSPSGRPDALPPVQLERSRFHRSRQLVAALAALVVVALFISVFATQSQKRGVGSTPTSTATHGAAHTATSAPTSGATHLVAVPKLAHLSGMPVFSSFDPNTVYVVNGARITRSDDGGATWTTLPNPANFPAGLTVSWIDLFVSPLSNKTVYATADLSNPDNSQVNNCPAPLPLGHIGAKVALSGVVPCEATEISTDAGATWNILRLPGNFELGSASPNAMGFNQYNNYSANPVAQGNQITFRLYSLAGHGPLASVGPDRLFSSGDGGVTWQYADSALVARGQNPCQFAAPSLGATLYAVTVPSASSCDPAFNAPPQLWRSDDGGASWRQETLPPGRTVLATLIASGQQPMLYLVMPAVSTQSHVGVSGASGTDIFVSADGGATWSQAPAAGMPTTPGIFPNGGATLSDGSLVVAFNDAPLVELYTWKPGSHSWSKLASTDSVSAPSSLLNMPTQGHDVLWLIVVSGTSAGQPTYSVLMDTL
ncbi:MAG TPA: hypothetical protein VJN88_10460 [Ktedonobacterales bacterium]|nr:hypothetical protein [Ktedonobacterales bacterium]